MTKTFTELVAESFQLPPLPHAMHELPPRTRCVLTGREIATGYPVSSVVSAAQGEWWDTFNGNPYGFMSDATARCWAANNPRPGGSLVCAKSFAVFGSIAYEPMVSQKSADAQGRPSWRDLARRVLQRHQGDLCAISFSSDTKKRVWTNGVAGVVGKNTPVSFFDTALTHMHQNLFVDWQTLVDDLNFLEQEVYSHGYYRNDVLTNLFFNAPVGNDLGWPRAAELENELAVMRKRPHWPFLINIARWADKKTGEIV